METNKKAPLNESQELTQTSSNRKKWDDKFRRVCVNFVPLKKNVELSKNKRDQTTNGAEENKFVRSFAFVSRLTLERTESRQLLYIGGPNWLQASNGQFSVFLTKQLGNNTRHIKYKLPETTTDKRIIRFRSRRSFSLQRRRRPICSALHRHFSSPDRERRG